jgi:ferrous iron transport protein B
MSCGARLPVYVLFAGVFFAASSGTVIWSLYVMAIALAIVMGLIFKRTLFKGEAPMFIMELPPYRMPSFRSLCLHTWEKGKHFLIKAGTYILAVSILVWFMLNLPWGVESKKDSYLSQAGQVMAPVFEPLGFGTWETASSLITGVIAKEIVVGTMGEI